MNNVKIQMVKINVPSKARKLNEYSKLLRSGDVARDIVGREMKDLSW